MAFCTKCGRQLQDGEVCNCQQTATPVTPINPAPQAGQSQAAFTQPAGQPQAGSTQPAGQQQAAFASSAAAPAKPNPAANIFKEIMQTALGLLKTPVETTASATQKASFPVAGVIIAIVALVEGLFDMFSSMVSHAQSSSGSLDSWESLFSQAFNKPNYFLVFLASFLTVLGVAALGAVIYMVLVQALGGGKITYVQGLQIAAMTVIFQAVASPVSFIIGAIPAGFFGALAGWIVTFAATLGTVYAILAVKSVIVKMNSLPYIFACVAVVNSFVAYIFSLMI